MRGGESSSVVFHEWAAMHSFSLIHLVVWASNSCLYSAGLPKGEMSYYMLSLKSMTNCARISFLIQVSQQCPLLDSDLIVFKGRMWICAVIVLQEVL